jgi:hypothetical protein
MGVVRSAVNPIKGEKSRGPIHVRGFQPIMHHSIIPFFHANYISKSTTPVVVATVLADMRRIDESVLSC